MNKKIKKIAKKILPEAIQKNIQKTQRMGVVKAGSYHASSTFTVVSAVYNAEKYLDVFFDSLTKQSMNLSCLQLVMVDDGSTDSSVAKIEQWKKRYPELIVCLHKENGGQASARNYGLNYVKNEWVTFIDPDDFVAYDYFEQVDRALAETPGLQIVNCGLSYYFEKTDSFRETRQANYRNKTQDGIYSFDNNNHPIQLSMSIAFFKTEEIRRQNLQVNEQIKPNFEDGDFINRYLLGLLEGKICFTSKARYYYRKRGDGTSSIDTSWSKPERLTVVPSLGYLELLKYAKELKGNVPGFIQNTVLYDLSWYFKRFVKHPENCNNYSKADISFFLDTLKEVFSYIDAKIIHEANEAWFSHAWKQALLKRYGKELIASSCIFLESFNKKKNLFSIKSDSSCLFLSCNGNPLHALKKEKRTEFFFDNEFCVYWIYWFELPLLPDAKISFSINNQEGCLLATKTARYQNEIDLKELLIELEKISKNGKNAKKSVKKIAYNTAKDFTKNKLPETLRKRIKEKYSKRNVTVAVMPKISQSAASFNPKATYSIVSAVYNVSSYLNDYFESIFSQTINSEKLELIIVDDGSTDNSAEIINQWSKRYPGRITYLYKENGGQASARNYGIPYAKNEWITFIDPDDFVPSDYFEIVDKEIAKQTELKMVCCKCVYYYEDRGEFSDTHPLNYQYPNCGKTYSINDEKIAIHLRVNNAFFKTEIVKKNQLIMPENMRPSFEGVYFANRYLLSLDKGNVLFLGNAPYYYRKRSAKTSSLDGGWLKPEKITVVPKNGWLGLINEALALKGHVPLFIQRVILFNFCWYIQRYCWHPNRWEIFSEKQLDVFNECLDKVFEHINYETLIHFPDKFINQNSKYYLAKKYYDRLIEDITVHIKDYNPKKRNLRVFSPEKHIEMFADGAELKPIETKVVTSSFMGREFYSLYYFLYEIPSGCKQLSCVSEHGQSIKMRIRGKEIEFPILLNDLQESWTANWNKYKQNEDTWLLMDRDTQADDNAEHFYRWLKKNHPEQKCYFALRNTSNDWFRLKEEGFNLVNFASKEYEAIVKSCSKIISSHADPYIYSYYDDSFYQSKDFIFLQHGVTQNGIYSWLNNVPISLMTTATKDETDYIVEDGSSFKLMPGQVKLTGFARYDALLEKAKKFKKEEDSVKQKTILIMPTWRHSLMGKTRILSNEKELNFRFGESQYARAWQSVLGSDKLRRIASKNNIRIVFYPHANIIPYVMAGYFKVPDYIEIHSNERGDSVQDDFVVASLLVTDYSSVAFDVAMLGKPCLYYQFDADEFFTGGHMFSRGYFDYGRNAFGPVVFDEKSLIGQIESCVEDGFVLAEEYMNRIEKAFPFRNGGCCKRIYDEITN